MSNVAKAKAGYQNYKRSSMRNLHEAYQTFSDKKYRAWEYCEKLCNEKNGNDLRVASRNRTYFTAGFTFEDEDGNTRYMHIAPTYDQDIIITKAGE